MPAVERWIQEVDAFFAAVLPLYEARLSGERARLERERLRDGMSADDERTARASIQRSLRAIWLQNEENELLTLI
eukprot:1376695-Prymnesium_polylepis.1